MTNEIVIEGILKLLFPNHSNNNSAKVIKEINRQISITSKKSSVEKLAKQKFKKSVYRSLSTVKNSNS